jgi:hypothetical protein
MAWFSVRFVPVSGTMWTQKPEWDDSDTETVRPGRPERSGVR